MAFSIKFSNPPLHTDSHPCIRIGGPVDYGTQSRPIGTQKPLVLFLSLSSVFNSLLRQFQNSIKQQLKHISKTWWGNSQASTNLKMQSNQNAACLQKMEIMLIHTTCAAASWHSFALSGINLLIRCNLVAMYKSIN